MLAKTVNARPASDAHSLAKMQMEDDMSGCNITSKWVQCSFSGSTKGSWGTRLVLLLNIEYSSAYTVDNTYNVYCWDS